MWDGLLILLLLSIVMGAASFLAGLLPLTLSLSSRQLRLITALGTGVLVGTSLIVIIPEGVETLYSARGSSHGHDERSLSLARRAHTTRHDHITMPNGHESKRQDALHVAHILEAREDVFATGSDNEHGNTEPTGQSNAEEGSGTSIDSDTNTGAQHEGQDPHAWIGISLILGFILMYLIDTLPKQATAQSQPQRFHISLDRFSFHRAPSVSNESAETPTTDTFASAGTHAHDSTARASSTTVGLVIHAAADGIALGASSTANSHLSFVIFIALMIHKAPAAFGLTSVLLKQGLSKRMARAHLIVFSFAAPVGALVTWSAVHLLGFSSGSLGASAGTEFATGVLLLFSGGTFLYVAMHTMQESGAHDPAPHQSHANGYVGVPGVYSSEPSQASPPASSTALVDILVTVAGMLLPLLTQWGHAH